MHPEKAHMYWKIFNDECNLSFHLPSKDSCEKCDILKVALITTKQGKKVLLRQKKQHLMNAELAYNQKRTKLMLQLEMIVLL